MKITTKKLAIIALAIGFSALVVSSHCINGKAAVSFAGGNGTSDNPYVIETISQLQEVKSFNGSYFVQSNDID